MKAVWWKHIVMPTRTCGCWKIPVLSQARIIAGSATSSRPRNAPSGGVDAYALMDAAAETIPAGSEGLIMLPCLMGAMAPTWNALARGTFMGFTLAHRS